MSIVDRLVDQVRRIPALVVDGALAAAIFGIGTYEFVTAYDPYPAAQRPAAIGLLALAVIGVSLRRTSQWTACALLAVAVFVALLTDNGFPDGASTELIELVLLYTVSERCGAGASALALIAAFAMQFTALRHGLLSLPLIIFVFSIPIALAWFAGRAQARRRAVGADLERGARDLEDERDRLARSSVATERARIAGELQALVSRGVEEMIAETRAARRRLSRSREGISDRIGRIEETGRTTLAEMRRLLVVLRSTADATSPSLNGTWPPEHSIDRASEEDSPPRATSPMARRWRIPLHLTHRAQRLIATPRVIDGLVVLALAAYQIVSSFWLGPLNTWIDLVLLGLVLGMLLFRQVSPLLVLLGIASGIFIWNLFHEPYPSTADWAFIVAVYTVALLRGPSWGTVAIGAEVVAYAPLFGLPGSCSGLCLVSVMSWTTTFVLAVIAGVALRGGRRLNDQLQEQTDVLRMTREERVRRAVVAERSRIARDVHDMVAHGVTLMVIQAGAARWLFESDPPRAELALGSVERAGDEALRELHALVGSLGDAADRGHEPLPAGEHLTVRSLVGEAVESRMRVELIVYGEPHRLPAGLEVSLYRIVQEALTNVRKHAPGASTRVVLRYTPEGVEVDVTDAGGRGALDQPAVPGAGQGLIGIAERAALFGGRAEAGPTGEGGFRVHVSMTEERVLV